MEDGFGLGYGTVFTGSSLKLPGGNRSPGQGQAFSEIRVSSKVTNGLIILNLDCDMYSNNLLSVQDALCFFMDEEKSHDIVFVQYPLHFENLTMNDIHSNSL
ncbi:hypothetical protein GH714_041826 [Hevea brasiliensis]|uniref:Uncharacterized protein n=1 Tax=Hevea brasiliensis TaxID=3981 RepID=A0A6A6MV76_HEVBR|nr:hypothetical protein GH714_041826 [Hevea brasiliensis]